MPAPRPRPPARAARTAERAQQARHLAERAAVESLLRRGDLLGLQDVELHDVLGALELAHAAGTCAPPADRRGCRRASNSLSSGPRFERSSTWKLAADSSISPKSAMLFGVNFCRNVALLLLISPGMHDQRRALLAGVRVLDRLVDRLVGRRHWPSATFRLPAVGDGLPNVGCADAPAAQATTSDAPSGELERVHRSAGLLMAILLRDPRWVDGTLSAYFGAALRRPRQSGVAAIIAVEPGHDFVGLLVDERQRHPRDVGARVGARARIDIRK